MAYLQQSYVASHPQHPNRPQQQDPPIFGQAQYQGHVYHAPGRPYMNPYNSTPPGPSFRPYHTSASSVAPSTQNAFPPPPSTTGASYQPYHNAIHGQTVPQSGYGSMPPGVWFPPSPPSHTVTHGQTVPQSGYGSMPPGVWFPQPPPSPLPSPGRGYEYSGSNTAYFPGPPGTGYTLNPMIPGPPRTSAPGSLVANSHKLAGKIGRGIKAVAKHKATKTTAKVVLGLAVGGIGFELADDLFGGGGSGGGSDTVAGNDMTTTSADDFTSSSTNDATYGNNDMVDNAYTSNDMDNNMVDNTYTGNIMDNNMADDAYTGNNMDNNTFADSADGGGYTSQPPVIDSTSGDASVPDYSQAVNQNMAFMNSQAALAPCLALSSASAI